MVDYYPPNLWQNMYAANTLQNMFNTQADRDRQQQNLADMVSAGKLAAGGDYESARDALYAGGHFEQANFMDPQQARTAILARSNMMQQAIENERQRRQDELAQLRGSTTYTVPGAEGQPPLTVMRTPAGQWTEPVPTPPGVNLNSPLTTAPKAAKPSQQGDAVKAIKDAYAAQYPDRPPLNDAQALSAATAVTSKFNAGLSVTGWQFGAGGKPTLPIYDAPQGTAAALRANQWDQDAQFARSRAMKSGAAQAQADQRAATATAFINHMSMAEEHLREPGMDDVLGAIHGNATYQKWRGSMFPGDVETPRASASSGRISKARKPRSSASIPAARASSPIMSGMPSKASLWPSKISPIHRPPWRLRTTPSSSLQVFLKR